MALSLCDCFHNCSVVLLLHQQPTCKLQSRRRTSARSHIADNICPDTLSEGEERISQILLRFSLCKKVSPLQIFWPGRSSSKCPPSLARPTDPTPSHAKRRRGVQYKESTVGPRLLLFPLLSRSHIWEKERRGGEITSPPQSVYTDGKA